MFNQPGGGMHMILGQSVDDLIKQGYLGEVNPMPWDKINKKHYIRFDVTSASGYPDGRTGFL